MSSNRHVIIPAPNPGFGVLSPVREVDSAMMPHTNREEDSLHRKVLEKKSRAKNSQMKIERERQKERKSEMESPMVEIYESTATMKGDPGQDRRNSRQKDAIGRMTMEVSNFDEKLEYSPKDFSSISGDENL
jgi:hypothetical protein